MKIKVGQTSVPDSTDPAAVRITLDCTEIGNKGPQVKRLVDALDVGLQDGKLDEVEIMLIALALRNMLKK